MNEIVFAAFVDELEKIANPPPATGVPGSGVVPVRSGIPSSVRAAPPPVYKGPRAYNTARDVALQPGLARVRATRGVTPGTPAAAPQVDIVGTSPKLVRALGG